MNEMAIWRLMQPFVNGYRDASPLVEISKFSREIKDFLNVVQTLLFIVIKECTERRFVSNICRFRFSCSKHDGTGTLYICIGLRILQSFKNRSSSLVKAVC